MEPVKIVLDCQRGRNGKHSITVRLNGQVLAAEELNLLKQRQRTDFAERLCKGQPGINQTELDAELLQLAGKAAADAAKTDSSASAGKPDLLATTPPEIIEAARGMLLDPDLIRRVVDDVGALGVAGEKMLRATVYLIGTSRLLPKPLAGIVQGLTASGKTFVIDKTARLFPPETVIWAHKMTPEALVHMKPGALEHRFIVAGERSRKQDDDTADATRALREMLSDGKLTKLVPMKGGDGKLETVNIQQPGPIAYIESTTLQTILDEDRNRCIVLQTDETPEQTRRIIDLAAARKAGSGVPADTESIIARHHAAQRLLRRCIVRIPFAGRLGQLFPCERTDARRSFGHLLSMIEAVALLYQYQRIDEPADGVVIDATANDYAIAQKLLAKPLARALGRGLSDAARRFGERLRAAFGAGEFGTREAGEKETVIGDTSTIRQYIRDLTDAGEIVRTQPYQKGKPGRYRMADERTDLAVAARLPEVAEIFSTPPSSRSPATAQTLVPP